MTATNARSGTTRKVSPKERSEYARAICHPASIPCFDSVLGGGGSFQHRIARTNQSNVGKYARIDDLPFDRFGFLKRRIRSCCLSCAIRNAPGFKVTSDVSVGKLAIWSTS